MLDTRPRESPDICRHDHLSQRSWRFAAGDAAAMLVPDVPCSPYAAVTYLQPAIPPVDHESGHVGADPPPQSASATATAEGIVDLDHVASGGLAHAADRQ